MVQCLHQLGEQRGPLDHSLGMNPAIPGKAIEGFAEFQRQYGIRLGRDLQLVPQAWTTQSHLGTMFSPEKQSLQIIIIN